MLAMAGMSGTVLSVSSIAQEKAKDTKKDDTKKDTKKDTKADDTKKDTKKAVVKPGIVKINEGKDGKFRFSIYNVDEKFLAMSSPSGYKTKEEAVKGLEDLKNSLKDAKTEYGQSDAKKEQDDKEKDKNK